MQQADPYAGIAVLSAPAPSAPPRGQTSTDPYASIAAPVQAPSAPRPAPPRPRAAQSPAASGAAPVAGPAAPSEPLNDLGITQDEEIEALVRQGYTMAQAREFASQEAQDTLARYQAANPDDTGATVIEYGQPGYPGSDTRLDPASNTYVALTPGEIEARRRIAEREATLADMTFLGSTPGEYGITDEATGFLNDEMAYAAGGLGQGISNFIDQLRGRESPVSMREMAEAEREAALAERSQFQKDKPLQSLLGSVLGGAAFAPIGPAGLLTGVGQGAGIGAAIGFAEGGSDPDMTLAENLLDRGRRGAIEGAIGGTVAGGMGLTPEIGRRTLSGLSEAGARVGRGFGIQPGEAVITPRATESAERYVAGILQRSGADLAGNPTAAMGKPITAAEAMGPNGVSQVAALTRRSGRTGLLAQDQLGQRASEQPARIVQDFADLTGMDPAGSADMIQNLARSGRQAAAPLYEAAYARPGAVRSEVTDDLLQRPSMQRALRNAVSIAREEGRDPTTMGFDFDEAGDVIHVREPSMQTMDYIKRGLDDVLNGYRDPVTRRLNLDTEGRAVNDTATAFRRELVRLNPAYGEALQAGGDPIRLEEAFSRAGRLFQTGTNERTFATAIERMGEGERNALVAGLADDLYTRAQAGRLRPRELRLPVFQGKLRALLGDDAAASFTSRVEAEIALAASGGRMAPGTNSVSAEALEAMREQDQGVGLFADLARNIEQTGPIQGTTRTAVSAVAAPIAGFVRGFQAPASQPVRDEIGRMLLMPPDDLLSRLQNVRPSRRGLLAPAEDIRPRRGLLRANP